APAARHLAASDGVLGTGLVGRGVLRAASGFPPLRRGARQQPGAPPGQTRGRPRAHAARPDRALRKRGAPPLTRARTSGATPWNLFWTKFEEITRRRTSGSAALSLAPRFAPAPRVALPPSAGRSMRASLRLRASALVRAQICARLRQSRPSLSCRRLRRTTPEFPTTARRGALRPVRCGRAP